MSFYLGADFFDGNKKIRIYDTNIPLSETDFEKIVKDGFLPEKYYLSAKEVIENKHEEIDISSIKFSLRKDNETPIAVQIDRR